MGSSPIVSSTGPTMGTTTKMISMKSRKKPMKNIRAMTTNMAPKAPPGISASTASTISSPPRPRNTSEKTDAPSRMTKTMAEIFTVDCITSDRMRSEEHTSELQSLMRISYAVFCLKKKKKKTQTRSNTDVIKLEAYQLHYAHQYTQYISTT